MRKVGASLLILTLLTSLAYAQLTVEVLPEAGQFLSGEEMLVAVKVTNRSGQKLKFGTDNSWLSFTVEEPSGTIVSALGEAQVQGDFVLESSQRATKYVDIGSCFAVDKPGRYLITATVSVKEWGKDFRSVPKGVDVIDGTRIWEREIGVPSKDTNAEPVLRKYVLQQANFVKGRLRLYLRITDGTGLSTLRLVPIGNLVSFSRPDPQVDSESNLHLIYQAGPQMFVYHKFTPDGTLVLRHTYEIEKTRPRLKLTADGIITVIGGVRRELPTDYPPPEEDKKAPEKKPEPAAEKKPEPNVEKKPAN